MQGKSIDWGRWAITADDPHFNGEGNPDTGEAAGWDMGEGAG